MLNVIWASSRTRLEDTKVGSIPAAVLSSERRIGVDVKELPLAEVSQFVVFRLRSVETRARPSSVRLVP